MKRRVMSLLMALALCLSMLPAAALAAEEPEPRSALTADATPPEIPTEGDVWDGETITQPSRIVKKDGVNYYEISTCAELAYVAQTGGDWLSRNYLLANNLILNDVVLEWDEEGNILNDPTTLHEWTPIGDGNGAFSGTFNGCQYIISGTYVMQEEGAAGLFRNANNASIMNLNLVNAYIQGNTSVGGIASECNGISCCTFQGIVKGYRWIGGIVAWGSVINCVNYGKAMGSGESIGGITGYGGAYGCVNYGEIHCGTHGAGGISGYNSNYSYLKSVSNCANYGTVFGIRSIGGIVGSSDQGRGTNNCINYGTVSGTYTIGGIVGNSSNDTIRNCVNYGTIAGVNGVGGIAGGGSSIIDCYSTIGITGESDVGGIVGCNYFSGNLIVTNCYTIGNNICTSEEKSIGAIVGSDGAVWDKDTITGCYYLKTDTVNSDLYGCGGVSSEDMEPEGFYARNEAAMKQQSTYESWDFDSIWRISPDRNGGYPYLAIEDELPGGGSDAPIAVQALVIHEASLSLGVGDTVYLTATPSPMNADISALTWSSSDNSIVQVSQNGRITAVAPGSATITATCGGVSASCTVTVTPRASDEYALGTLVVRDESGTELSAIPRGNSLVTIPITKQSDGGNALVLLAAYGADGQYQGLMYVQVKNVPLGATVEITLPLNNADGKIARLKAFPVASFRDPTPLGAASEFPQS